MSRISLSSVWRGYWKVLVVAVAAAIVAYAVSFFFSTTYESQTKLLVRSNSQSILSNANGTSSAPVVNGTDLSKALSDTQSALLATNTVAQDVVAKLQLDKHPPPSGGFFHKIKGVYHDLSDLLKYGHLVHVPLHQAIVANVYNSLSASQVSDSYVLALDATASNPKLAAAIANAAADALVQVANHQFQSDATALASQLAAQLKIAANTEQAAAQALSSYESSHNVSLTVLQSGTASDRRAQLDTTTTDISNDQAKLQAAQSELTTIPQTISTTQSITTGRSTTEITSQTPNPSYATLQSTIFTLMTTIAGLKQKQISLEASLGATPDPPSGTPSSVYAGLQQLYTASQTSSAAYSSLSAEYQAAVVNAATTPVELVRLDTAQVPNFPIKPDRALYGLIGLLFGLAIGFVLSHRGRRSLAAAFGDLGRARTAGAASTEPLQSDAHPTAQVPIVSGTAVPPSTV